MILEELADDDVVEQALETIRNLIAEHLEVYLDEMPFYAAYKVELVKKRPHGGSRSEAAATTMPSGTAARGGTRIRKAIRFTILFEGSDEDLLEYFGLPFGIMQAVEGFGVTFDMTPNITSILSQAKRKRGSMLQRQTVMHGTAGESAGSKAATVQLGPDLVLNAALKLRAEISVSFNKTISAYLARTLASTFLRTVREADASVTSGTTDGDDADDFMPVSLLKMPL